MKYIVFTLQILLIAAVAIWFSYFPGTLKIDWQDYAINAPLSITMTSLVIVIFLLLFSQKMITRALDFFRQHKVKGLLRKYKKLESLAIEALSAYNLGNMGTFLQNIKAIKKLDPKSPLAQYLSLQSVIHGENEEDVLDEINNASPVQPLVLKWQVEKAFSEQNYQKALLICQKSLQKCVEPWFIKAALFAEIKLKNFEKSIEFVEMGVDQQALSKEYNNYISAIIWYQFAKNLGPNNKNYMPYLFKAHRANLKFTNAAVHLANALFNESDRAKAEKVLEDTWRVDPVYQIAITYCDMGETPVEKAQRARKLLDMQPASSIAHVTTIYYYIEAALWGEAQRLLTISKEENFVQQWEVDYLEALIAHDQHKSPEQAYDLLKKSFDYHLLNKWICQYCGHKSLSWQPFCEKCDAFDHIAYEVPKSARVKVPIFPS